MLLNHCNSSPVFFHWIRLVAVLTSLIILVKICLDILPICVLLLLINLHLTVAGKLSLWSFTVIYACDLSNLGIRLLTILFSFKSSCARESIVSAGLLLHFL